MIALATAGCETERDADAAANSTARRSAGESQAAPGSSESDSNRASPATGPTPAPVAADPAARELYFGDLHVHTGWSFDAFDAGVRTGPADAYRFARGEAIPHAMGATLRLAGPPLDFIAVTDHAEYLGLTLAAERADHPLRRQPLIRSWLGDDPQKNQLATRRIRSSLRESQPLPALIADDVLPPAWQEAVALANAHDRPGEFSALVGFEYTSNPERQNLHRNVIFRGARVPARPFSAFDSENPEDLWTWMDEVRTTGDDVIAIPHNANGSNGLMFAPTRFDGSAIDAAWAEQRARNEPVAEVMQIKGQSDTTPGLSPGDEWADFEVLPWQTLRPSQPSRESGSYVREALGVGLSLRERLGIDPFALGMIGSTDTHNAASPVVESDYFGKLGRADGSAEKRLERRGDGLGTQERLGVSAYWSAAGLAGVWAHENSRAALFDALRRRETFATSGPRIRVQVFAGFDFTADDARGDLARVGRAKGVPMGGELSARAGAGSPRLLVAAQQDPLEAPLERLQVIKLWRAQGATKERVFDVACAGGAEPDPIRHRCAYSAPPPDPADCRVSPDRGARELVASWVDPDFAPDQHALYAVRVLQVPTCRWSSFDAIRLGVPRPEGVPATIQERALTSPIWIRPTTSRAASGGEPARLAND